MVFHSLLQWTTLSEVIDISPGNLDSSLCFLQPSISHDVLCIEVKIAGWQYTALTYSFSYFEPVCCSMSSFNCFFLTCIQISQEAGQVVWYSHVFQNFPQLIVIHTVKGFGIVNNLVSGYTTYVIPSLLLFSCHVLSHSFVTPWAVAHQASPSMGFSRQECWSGLPFSSPGTQGLLHWQVDSLPLSYLGS